jgi:hypothetical protein
MAIIQANDFAGEYKISQSRFTELDLWITKYEKYYLLRMMGADLYSLFIADLTLTTPQIPQTARFLNIFNAFNYIPSYPESMYISEGIKKMLVQLIYFHYVRESNHFNTIAGQVTNSNENSTAAAFQSNLIKSYNDAIDNYCNIQMYIQSDAVAYPEYVNSQVYYLDYSSGI